VSHTRRVSFSIATTAESACTLPNFESASEVWRDNAGVICARGILSGAYAWLEFPGTAVFHFDRARRAVIAMPEPSVEDGLLYDNYYRAALPLALQYFGVEVLHASAVRTRLGVVAFCAVSETGKSTAVAVLSRRGYPLWADDAVPIEIDEGTRGARAFAVPFRMLRFHRRSETPTVRFVGQSRNGSTWCRPRWPRSASCSGWILRKRLKFAASPRSTPLPHCCRIPTAFPSWKRIASD